MARLLLYFIASTLFYACSSQVHTEIEVDNIVIAQSTDISTLNPVNAGDQFSVYLGMLIFQPLIALDYKTNTVKGVIAEKLPKVSYGKNGKMLLNYSIRNKSEFSKGIKIKAEDVIFSLKINIFPLIDNLGGNNYYNFIEDIQQDPTNLNKIIITCKNAALLNTYRSGDFMILPRHVYDSANILGSFSFQELANNKLLEQNKLLIQFSNDFNKNTSNPKLVTGSGPYQLELWSPQERIVLKRKNNWWADSIINGGTNFIANAEKINFEIIGDEITAISALKSGEVDFVHSISAMNFSKLNSTQNIVKDSILEFGFNYLGFNLNNEILSEKLVRKAIEATIPFNKIAEIVFKNQGKINRLPLSVQQTELRNNSIQFEDQNIIKANKLLEKAGWLNNENGRSKNGKKLNLNFHYNNGNRERKAVGLILKSELTKIGIDLTVKSLEWTTYLKTLRSNEVDIFMSGLKSSPLPPDFSDQFHSKSANGGRNYANYQNSSLDAIIDSINIESSKLKRIELIKTFQEIVAEDSPYIYLFTTQQRIAYSKKLKDVVIYNLRPNYWAPEMH